MARILTSTLSRYSFSFALCMCCSSGYPAEEEPIGMITDLWPESSPITIEDGTRKALLDTLKEGDRLRVPDDTRVNVVLYQPAMEVQIAGPAYVRISAMDVATEKSAAVLRRHLQIVTETGLRPGFGVVGGGVVMRGGADEGNNLRLEFPLETVILTERPTFSWRGGGEAPYRMRLLDEDGTTVLEQTVEDTEYYPVSDLQLKPESLYTWIVDQPTLGIQRAPAVSHFLLASKEHRASAKTHEPGPGASVSDLVVYAQLLETIGAHQNAIAIWRSIHSLRPASAQVAVRSRGRTE